MNKITMEKVMDANPTWFSSGNKKFSNDIDYWTEAGKITNNSFLVRSTYGFTDMFGGRRTKHYRINTIDQETLQIGSLIDTIFKDWKQVDTWLSKN